MMVPACVMPMVRVGERLGSPPGVGPGWLMAASPKSSTLTRPVGVIMTLPGFKSRCTTPLSWAASRASAIWRAMGRASARGMAPRLMRAASVSPGTSSIASARWPRSSTMP